MSRGIELSQSKLATHNGTVITSANLGDGPSVGGRAVRGIINTASAGSIVQGTGFTIVRNGAGDVTVTITTPFTEIPVVMLTTFEDGTITPPIVSLKNGSSPAAGVFEFQVAKAGIAADAVVHFHASAAG